MAGIEFIVKLDFRQAGIVIDNLARLDRRELLEGLAQQGEQQTKSRIASEKKAPDGTAWPDWSPEYAETRHGGQSLLQGEGGLLESIAAAPPDGNQISWGADLVYAAVHQFGHTFDNAWGRGIKAEVPARSYLGLSRENQREMEQTALAFIAEVLR